MATSLTLNLGDIREAAARIDQALALRLTSLRRRHRLRLSNRSLQPPFSFLPRLPRNTRSRSFRCRASRIQSTWQPGWYGSTRTGRDGASFGSNAPCYRCQGLVCQQAILKADRRVEEGRVGCDSGVALVSVPRIAHGSRSLITLVRSNHIALGVDLQTRVRWAPRTVVLWDNRVTAHSAIVDFEAGDGRRHGSRITPQAEKPFLRKD